MLGRRPSQSAHSQVMIVFHWIPTWLPIVGTTYGLRAKFITQEFRLWCVVIWGVASLMVRISAFGEWKAGRSSGSTYDSEGIIRAVEHFRQQGIRVLVVSRRSETKSLLPPDIPVIVAPPTDDVMILKQSFKWNCPIVSGDAYRKWRDDPRLETELKRWLEQIAVLQVRWAWDENGSFQPDFDLPRPVLKAKIS